MGNTETRAGSGTVVRQLEWPAPKAVPAPCRVDDEAELRALRALPTVSPVNARVLHANFVTRAQATAPVRLDARPLMLLIWEYHGHVRERADAAAAQQDRVHAQLRASGATLARACATLTAHAETVGTLTHALGAVAAAAGTVRDTAIRASYAQDAAERLDRVMALVESEIEIEHPHLLAAIPDDDVSSSDDILGPGEDAVDALARVRLTDRPLAAPIAFM